jgi:uncharacterized repeat protein (TIGR01451 family)
MLRRSICCSAQYGTDAGLSNWIEVHRLRPLTCGLAQGAGVSYRPGQPHLRLELVPVGRYCALPGEAGSRTVAAMSRFLPPGWVRSVTGVAAAVLLVPGGAWAQGRQTGLSATGAAIATGSGLIETQVVAELLEAPGREGSAASRFAPANRLQAGDVVYYTVRVSNPGSAPITNVKVTKSMPQGLHYVAGSAVGPACDVEFSADGGTTFQRRPAEPDYTHVRWSLRRPLPPGATALLRFRAVFR